MKVGDLVEFEGVRWKVTIQRGSVCTLTNWAGEHRELPTDHDLQPANELPPVVVLCHPPEDWPFVQVRCRLASAGPVRHMTRDGQELRPMVDWIPGDFLRPGGPMFFNPDLRLRVGEVLTAKHQRGKLSRVAVSRGFGTVARKRARHLRPQRPPGPQNVYDRLVSQDPFGELDE